MSDKAPPAAAAAAASKPEGKDGKVHGVDIANVLSSSGPVVNCVLLRHMRKDAKDVKPHPVSTKIDESHKREVLTELIEEIQVDTTPSKSAIRGILGPFTFIGQFPTEGIVAMAAKELPDDLKSLSISNLRELCEDAGIDTKGMLEKNELVQALEITQMPVNPHKLQPPLDDIVVRGDILLLKVAETEEELDDPNGANEEKEMKILSNEEFFLNYSKEEYIAFASRTDVVAPEPEEEEEDAKAEGGSEEEDEREEEEEEDEEDEDFNPVSDGNTDEEEKCAMLNLIMAEVLRKFREDRGRGPNSEELLELRRQVATPLGIEVATVSDISSKRAAEDSSDSGDTRPTKRVKFTGAQDGATGEASDEDQDKKPAAATNGDAPAEDEDKEEKTEDSKPES